MPSLKMLKSAPATGQASTQNADSAPKLESINGKQPSGLSALEREFLPPLLEIQETPPSPTQRKVLWTIIALVVVLIAWACVGEISITSTAPGKFIPDGRVKQMQPLESAIVKSIRVKEGQHVEQGDLLIELDPTINEAELKANSRKFTFNRLEQTRLAAELTHSKPSYTKDQPKEWVAFEESSRKAREQAHAAKLAEAKAAVEDKANALAAAEATLKKYEETGVIAAEREASARPLVDTGAISKLDYLQLKQELIANQNDLTAQQKTVAQSRAALSEAEHRSTQVERDRVAQLYSDLDQKVSDEPSLKGNMDKSAQLYELKWLNAPVSGIVQRIEVTTIGQVVSPAQNLITIVPDGTPLIVEATLSNQDIGYVKVGHSVEIKVDTFPFQKYGSLKGTLVWISADAEEKGSESNDPETRSGKGSNDPGKASNSPSSGNAGYSYKVHIRPEETSFVVDGKRTPILPGMTVQADIITDHRRVIEFFLSPVIKYLDEGLKVR
jgi:hemolysin D